MAVPVEPDVSEAKLAAVLSEGSESSTLDYKAQCDLRDRRDIVEITKDIAAMQVDGGYLAVGVDDSGKPSGALQEAEAKLFDEASLAGIVGRYFDGPVELRSAVHQHEGDWIALVYVAPNPEGLAVLAAPGEYQGPKGMVTVFKPGDVFIRRGTSSVRWEQHEIRRVIAKRVEAEKDRWRTELIDEFERLNSGGARQRLPADALTWEIAADDFESLVVEQIRDADEIPLQLLLSRMTKAGERLIEDEAGRSDLWKLLDRLTCVAALAIRLDREELLGRALGVFVGLYSFPLNHRGQRLPQPALRPEELFLAIVVRLQLLGAFAVRVERWWAVRSISTAGGRGADFEDGYYTSCISHGFVMANRAHLYTLGEGNERTTYNALKFAALQAPAIPCVTPDLVPDDERLIDSLCQFDLLSGLAAISAAGRNGGGVYVPKFGAFYSHRTEPAALTLIDTADARSAIFPEDDSALALQLLALSQQARRGDWRDPWDGFRDRRVQTFLQRHEPPPEDLAQATGAL